MPKITTRVSGYESHPEQDALRNLGKSTLFIMLLGFLVLFVSTYLSASTSYGAGRAEQTGEPSNAAGATKSVADSDGQTLVTYNRSLSVAILIAAALFAFYYLRPSNKTRGERKTGRGRNFGKRRK